MGVKIKATGESKLNDRPGTWCNTTSTGLGFSEQFNYLLKVSKRKHLETRCNCYYETGRWLYTLNSSIPFREFIYKCEGCCLVSSVIGQVTLTISGKQCL